MPTPDSPTPQHPATAHVAEAHKLRQALRNQRQQHPELDEAITKLELALSALTLQTGGWL